MDIEYSRYRLSRLSDRHVFILLAVVSVISRIPFLKTFELVAFDGTYYLNQARTLFSGEMAGAFPIGYPLAVAFFQLFLRDYELAGAAVSFCASIGSAMMIYLIARTFVRREFALLGALLLALNPLFIRLSLMELSESAYIFWVLLSLLFFIRQRPVLFGLAVGAAAITRPEAIAIAGLLWLSKIKKPKQLLLIGVSFIAVYAVNAVILTINAERVVLLPKSGALGIRASHWETREVTIDFASKQETIEDIEKDVEKKSVLGDYLHRLPREAFLLGRQVLPVVFLLALMGMRRKKYLFLFTSLVPFFVYPLATVRSEERFILPYVPALILYAVLTLGTGDLRRKTLRPVAVGLLFLTLIVSPMVNSDALTQPEEPQMSGIKQLGLRYRDQVAPGDVVADRKPYFSFYAGGSYLTIPLAPYEESMKYIAERNAKYLVLHQWTVHSLRPVFIPLLYSYMVINGELRYRQDYFNEAGEVVFVREREADPLEWTRLTPPGGAEVAPSWSPDGRTLAFRSRTSDGAGGIYTISYGSRQKEFPRKIADAPPVFDQLSWSPDAKFIAYAGDAGGDMNVYTVETSSGEVNQITSGGGRNMSPTWAPTGEEIAFSSERTGQSEIWVLNLSSGEEKQVTADGGNAWPAFSHSGEKLAWVKEGEGVAIMDGPTHERLQLNAPSKLAYAPTWSPDDNYLAVTAEDWGSWDIYLITADGSNALLLTKNLRRDAMPSWSPDGLRLALTSDVGEKTLSVWTVENLGPYFERLSARQDIKTLVQPKGWR